jgi:hypothetical protein
MDTTFWVGIVIGAILSLVMSVLANLYNDRIKFAIEGRRRLSLMKKLEDELRTYRLIKDIREGKPEAYVILTTNQMQLIMLGILTILLLNFGLYTSAIQVRPDSALNIIPKLFPSFIVISSIFCLWLINSRIKRLLAIRRKANHFEEYEKELKEKWGDIDL